jgi:hypothetical protein
MPPLPAQLIAVQGGDVCLAVSIFKYNPAAGGFNQTQNRAAEGCFA